MIVAKLLRRAKNRIAEVKYVVSQLRYFERCTGYHPCIVCPTKTLNEEILILKIRSSSRLNVYTDKIMVKELIKKRIDTEPSLSGLAIPQTLGVYTNTSELMGALPQEDCIIKANHGSGMVYYYKVGQGIQHSDAPDFNDWLNTDYSVQSGEKCYEGIVPALFSERLLFCSDGNLPMDIKVHCARGSVLMTQLLDRSKGELRRLTFDASNRPKALFKNEVLSFSASDLPLNLACQYASTLAAEFDYARIDFYWVDKSLYFSEITFYPMSAAMPLRSFEADASMGRIYRNKKRQRQRERQNKASSKQPSGGNDSPSLALLLVGYIIYLARSPKASTKGLISRIHAQLRPLVSKA